MNLRTLKKLSKRAAPLLAALGESRGQFKAERSTNYHGCFVGDRKHWERGRCHASYTGLNSYTTPRGAEIVFNTRAGRRIVMGPPSHPRKGTVMVGGVSGYYEPEWDEESAWCALENIVYDHFQDWNGEDFILTRTFNSPSEILKAAKEIIARKNGSDQ